METASLKKLLAHLGLPFFLARCILLTGLSLIPAGTSPQIRALRFDSPDWQLQWQDTGGTVSYKLLLYLLRSVDAIQPPRFYDIFLIGKSYIASLYSPQQRK